MYLGNKLVKISFPEPTLPPIFFIRENSSFMAICDCFLIRKIAISFLLEKDK
jgi:hypothetical protein